MVTKDAVREAEQKVAAGASVRDDIDILNILQEMESGPGPGAEAEVVHRGDGDVPFPMLRQEQKKKNYALMLHNQTGRLKWVAKRSLPNLLRLKVPDDEARKAGLPLGSPAWLPPKEKWKGRVRVASVYCALHENHPQQADIQHLNLDPCFKPPFYNQRMADLHLKKKHRDAFEAIQQWRQEGRDQRRQDEYSALAKAVTKASRATRTRKKKAA